MSRVVLRLLVLVVVLLAVTAGVGQATKADPPTPSAAVTLQLGVPYTGAFSRTDRGRGWLRLPVIVHRQDKLQFAVSNDASTPYGSSVRFCLIPPVDDFGADDAVDDCSTYTESLGVGRKSRLQMTYANATGQAFLFAKSECSNCLGTYTVTLEKISTWVAVGWVKRSTVQRKLNLQVTARYGDNSAVANGTPVTLLWKLNGAPGKAWKKAGKGLTSNGRTQLRTTLPLSTKGKRVDLIACAGDIGNCARMSRVLVK